ncbi:hypothetical protein SUGI_0359310 [Cryptomeria japonica]|nr:hypothetical protein SUGI_0359310 [Cryptomeria japonica]
MHSHDDNFPGKSQFYAGLEKCSEDMKGLLFHREVSSLVCIVWEKARLCEYSSLSSEMVDDSKSNHSHDVNVPGKSHVYVGLGNHIADLKRRLVPQ